jgi:hypothetical protein
LAAGRLDPLAPRLGSCRRHLLHRDRGLVGWFRRRGDRSRAWQREGRIAVVVLECFMVAFGWLFASYTGTGQGFVDPGLLACRPRGRIPVDQAAGVRR